MAEKRHNAEDGGRVKRQKTEDTNRSNLYLKDMDDSDGGVPLYPSKPVKSEPTLSSGQYLLRPSSALFTSCDWN